MDSLKTLSQAQTDYDRVTRALAWLDAHWQDRPDLAAIAAQVDMSEHHFHRVFSRWTGTSAKRFVDSLAHAHARAELLQGESVMAAALAAGLSGPSRLHDLFLAFEAVTPGEAKSRGAGLTFAMGLAPTPFGMGVFLVAPRGLSALGFVDAGGEAEGFADMRSRYPAAAFTRDDNLAREWSQKIFVAHEKMPLALYGSPWQRQVWRALLAIPPGKTTTYGELAKSLGKPSAARAVGTAVGRNPVSWLIPCHRVLGSDARLTGYHWGVDRKRSMLAWEAANR